MCTNPVAMMRFILLLLFLSSSVLSFAQDTLPNFSVRKVGTGRNVIGWVNQFNNIRQISIQRSFDSLKNYKTILSVADPKAIQNGFSDTKAPTDSMWYRLFYAMEGGAFYFTQAKRPYRDTSSITIVEPPKIVAPAPKKPDGFVPSFYIYTNREGYVHISLPDADRKKYSIKFFEDDNTFLFELKSIKERSLTLDKTAFYHAGWFRFEIYNDDQLVERHKFYLAKDF